MIGVFNHLWISIETISGEHKITLHEFALVNNCINEPYWVNTLEDTECTKLMFRLLYY